MSVGQFGASLLLLPYVGVYLRIQSLRGTVVGNHCSTHTILTTDASSVGLGATLSQVQDGIEKPVYFISWKLHANETAFSSSELETLADVWAVERLHQYLYGRHFEIRTDHFTLKEA